jgi:hypothetical protein
MVQSIVTSVDWHPYVLVGTTLVGIFSAYFFSDNMGATPTSERLRKILPGRKDVFYDRVGLLLTFSVGTLVATIVFQPQTLYAAFAAGFSWPNAFAALETVSKAPPRTGGNDVL